MLVQHVISITRLLNRFQIIFIFKEKIWSSYFYLGCDINIYKESFYFETINIRNST